MAVPVLLNKGGGAVAADAGIADKVEAALRDAGVDAEIELIEGGDCEVRCKAIAERGDALLIVGGGDGTISAAASALVGTKTKLGILRWAPSIISRATSAFRPTSARRRS